jgi:hypothetical protein
VYLAGAQSLAYRSKIAFDGGTRREA